MIISRTPLRLSLFSGGSDLPSFYQQEPGAALSVSIDKYIYVMTHKTKTNSIRLKFDSIEDVNNLNEMQHVLTRETMRYLFGKVTKHNFVGMEISSMSDVSYNGCGLGSSSAFTVGLLNTLIYSDTEASLALAACKIEIDYCKYPIGKQDQYAAAHGGMNLWRFMQDGTVKGTSISYPDNMADKFVLMYTGRSRDGNKILSGQSKSMLTDRVKFDYVKRNRDRAFKAVDFINRGDLDSVGYLLNESWEDKKHITTGISDPYFDSIYDAGMKAGALGGKMMGAGGGGFFLFYASNYDSKMNIIRDVSAITGHGDMSFQFTDIGSKVIYRETQ